MFGDTVALVGGAENRRDVWSSRENAWEVFRSRRSWQAWDERILKIYVVSELLVKLLIMLIKDRNMGYAPSQILTLKVDLVLR